MRLDIKLFPNFILTLPGFFTTSLLSHSQILPSFPFMNNNKKIMAPTLKAQLDEVQALIQDKTITAEEGQCRRTFLLNGSTAPNIAPVVELAPTTEEGIKRVNFLQDRSNRMGPFDRPQLSAGLHEFIRNAKCSNIALNPAEQARFNAFRDVYPEWLIFLSKEQTILPLELGPYDGPLGTARLADTRRMIAELVALQLNYENRKTCPGSKDLGFGGQVAALLSTKHQLETTGVEKIKASPGISILSALADPPILREPPHKLMKIEPQPLRTPFPKASETSKECSYCKRPGHTISECLKLKFKDHICASCGLTGHSEERCHGKKDTQKNGATI